ncbi:MAG: cbb3-type cytochrome c oxidase subunit I, partial [Terrimicrobiaceae bacterium]
MSAITAEPPAAAGHAHHEDVGFVRKYLWTYDHKMIGLQYLWTALFFLFLGGALALLVRFQLAWPNTPVPIIGHLLPATVASDGAIIPGGYNMLVTMHATLMVFFVVMPLLIGTFGNYLIPLQIGAGDMAFPLLNELSYWLYVVSGFLILAAFFAPGGAPGTGWTAYAPLSAEAKYNGTQMGQSLWGIAIFVNGLSSIAGATNYITTVVNMRAPGMTMFRMPLTVWSLFIT